MNIAISSKLYVRVIEHWNPTTKIYTKKKSNAPVAKVGWVPYRRASHTPIPLKMLTQAMSQS